MSFLANFNPRLKFDLLLSGLLITTYGAEVCLKPMQTTLLTEVWAELVCHMDRVSNRLDLPTLVVLPVLGRPMAPVLEVLHHKEPTWIMLPTGQLEELDNQLDRMW